MKPAQKMRREGESCSCTTCVYKSESDHPSLRRFIHEGSRIDRLYYGKYIPLRERKLLDRLVRTRAVYDDIRAKLISDSTLSLSTKGEFKPRKKESVKELDDKEKSSGAILEFVNMVDRGAGLGAKLSDCCSCCSCSSKIQIHEHAHKRHRHKRHHAGEYEYHEKRLRETYNRKKGVRFKAKHIRSDPCTCTFKFSGLLKKHSKAIMKRKHPAPLNLADLQPIPVEEVKQKRKMIDITRTSLENLKQSNIRLKEKISEGINKMKESQIRIQEKIELQKKKSLEKIKQAKNKLTSKVREQKLKTKRNKIEREIALQIKKDSISKFKEDLRKKQIMKDWECEPECVQDTCVPEECFIKLKQKRSKLKNTYSKGNNYSIITQERKAGVSLGRTDNKIQAQKIATDKPTETEKLITREMKRTNIHKGNRKKKTQKVGVANTIDSNTNKTIKLKRSSLITSSGNKSVIKITPVTTLPEQKNVSKIITVITPEKKNIEKIKTGQSPKNTKLDQSSLSRKSSQRQAVRIGSSFSFNIEFYKNVPNPPISTVSLRTSVASKQRSGIDYTYNRPVKVKKNKKRGLRQRGSQIVLKKSLKDTQTTALKRCFCTLKSKAIATKSKMKRQDTKSVMTTEKSVLTLYSSTLPCNFDCTPDLKCKVKKCQVQTNTERKEDKNMVKKSNLLPYECEPGICVPGDCDPYQCIKLINIRKAKTKRSESCTCRNLSRSRKTKSTSSLSYNPSKAKYAQSMFTNRTNSSNLSKPAVVRRHFRQLNTNSKSHRQAVRIGSTFSFNIEFYKGAPYSTRPSELKTLSVKPKSQRPKAHKRIKIKNRGYQGNIRRSSRSTSTQIYKKERNALIGNSLKRCFCTLKLQRNEKLKNKKYFTSGTETIEPMYVQIDTANKGTKTKSKYPIPLEPFECEPFTCIPGSCNPYECLERINKRNLREIGLATDRPGTTSSSTNSEKSLKAAKVQYRPRYKERKVLVKPQKHKKYIEKKSLYEHSSIPTSKQAVKIGSSFSFDIEFYKNKSPTKESKYIYPSEKTSESSTIQRLKNKGIKINRLNVAHIDTQVRGPKTQNKSSVVRPLLKRCFCTLNLQKKGKRFKNDTAGKPFLYPPKVYTVNTAMIGKTQVVSCNKYEMKLRRRQDVYSESNKCFETYNIHSKSQIKRLENFIEETIDTRDFTKNKSALLSHSRLTNLTRYFRRYYCTMNLKVEDVRIPKRHDNITSNLESRKIKNNVFYKLKPYECEPGICVPGECNPYECQKMILNRLMKSAAKKSGTENSSQSISSSANQPFSKFKTYKQQTLAQKLKPYDYKKNNNISNKQAVHIGSTFRFDLQFSKNLSSSEKKVVPTYSSDTKLTKRLKIDSKSEGTTNKRNRNSQSQSAIIKAKHKGSFTMPSMKRCFCTLKLQKKGRLQKNFSKYNQTLIPLDDLNKVRTVDRSQNTKKYKPLKIPHSLKPYECEPGICIPGQCDPYQCLEKMKKNNYYAHKNDLGTSTMLYEPKSISSITDNVIKKRHRNRGVSVNDKKATNKSIDQSRNRSESPGKPLRKAVRIGSSFSFNVEFYKNQATPQTQYVQKEPPEIKYSKEVVHIPKLKNTDTMHNYSQNKMYLRHKKSQIKGVVQNASTLTNSFIKRCFCTAQLYKSKNTKVNKSNSERDIKSPSFLKKCMCLVKNMRKSVNVISDKSLKHMETRMKPKIQDETNKKVKTISVMTKNKTKLRPTALLPYECEPNFCVPYQCDPYECEKRIKMRQNDNYRELGISTIYPMKNSVASITDVYKKSKSKGQSIVNKTLNQYAIQNTGKYSEEEKVAQSKQAVRIGSSFSFNIEFFKDNNRDGFELEKLPNKDFYDKGWSKKPKERIKTNTNRTQIPMNKKLKYTSQTQMFNDIKTQSTMTAFSPLKRCFCTLSLRKPKKTLPLPIKTYASVSTETNMQKISKQPMLNLLPYECEPYICVPGECNPIKCYERIKRREYYRNSGTLTGHSNKKNVAINMAQGKRGKDEKSQFIQLKTQSISQKNNPLNQAVRIGSNFSFDIEFYKNKTSDINKNLRNQNRPQYDKVMKDYKEKNMGKDKKTVQKDLTKSKNKGINNKIQTTDTYTTAKPFLKRCFCVLKLRKNGNQVKQASLKTKSGKTQTKLRNYNKQKQSLRNKMDNFQTKLNNDMENKFVKQKLRVEPFECEPNVCVPGKCNPFECEKRIRKRFLREYSTETEMPSNISTYSATNDLVLKAAKLQTTNRKLFKQISNSKMLAQKRAKDFNRQVVRIGSNFSFDVEFFKTNYPKIKNMSVKPELKSKNSLRTVGNLQRNKLRNRSLQPTYVKKHSKGSSMGPFLKKCFCTLKLQNPQLTRIPKINSTDSQYHLSKDKLRNIKTIKNKSTATMKLKKIHHLSPFECEPLYCIPGECDPYECEKRIKMRENIIRDTTTQVCTECSEKCVGINAECLKSQKNQTNFIGSSGDIVSKQRFERPEIVEIPRFGNIFNKQAVRVGSNISFNIEFYKESIPQTVELEKSNYVHQLKARKRKNLHDFSDQNVNLYKLRSLGSQGDITKTENKAIHTDNVLKRCFCTLKLQNKLKTKNERQKPEFVTTKTVFPQTVEVRRVAVQHKPKMRQTHAPLKSVATKIDKKHLRENACLCRNDKTPLYDDMKTILPYVPTKFNKTASKTVLLLENKNNKAKDTLITNPGKRLTRKRSIRHLNSDKKCIPKKAIEKDELHGIKKLFCRCAQIFSRKTLDSRYLKKHEEVECKGIKCESLYDQKPQYKEVLSGIKSSKSERQTRSNQLSHSEPKKSKSLKLRSKINDRKKCKKTCPYYSNNLYQDGDFESRPPEITFKINDKLAKNKKTISKENKNFLCSHCLTNVRDDQKSIVNKSKGNSTPLKVRFLDTVSSKQTFHGDDINVRKHGHHLNNNPLTYYVHTGKKCKSCKYCNSCGKIIHKEEFRKGAGDQVLNSKSVNNKNSKKEAIDNFLKILKKPETIDNKCSGEGAKKPLFEMMIASDSYDILNKDEVIDNVSKFQSKRNKKRSEVISHPKSCRCCICLDKQNKIGIKINKKIKKASGKKEHPCICGSSACAKEFKKMTAISGKKWKRCICGSPICDRESGRIKRTCICQEEMRIRERDKSKIQELERANRIKKRKKEDAIRIKERLKQSKEKEKRIDKTGSDIVLLAENVLDIGKFGITACTDILRTIARTISDPKLAYRTLKSMKNNPIVIKKFLKTTYKSSGISHTTRRIRLRCLSMRGVNTVRSVLESYPFTKYLLYIGSKDPKRRLVKPQRVRERFNFGCSLYMGSLRKRPFLSIYDRCPWFYPHFLSIVTVWKQFLDITLFLLAVVVWSPCILCMELCRACMCCFFCTG